MSIKISHCLLIAHYTLTLAVFLICSASIIGADRYLLFRADTHADIKE